jgi:flavin reductase (DIM6/NTAB) family NADH-FMN oxidoreductase RutF
MVSLGDMEAPNIITIAWTGIVCSKPPMTYISVRPERHSYKILKEKREFVINLATEDMTYACDFCGTYTGAKMNKFERLGLTPTPSLTVGAPMILESPISLSCKVKEIIPLGSHDMFLAEIVGVSVSPALLTKDGRLDMTLARLPVFMHGAYYGVGKKLARIGCSTDKTKRKGKTK